MIVIGTDTHKRTHALSAVDEGTGKVRGSRQIDADEPGHLTAAMAAQSSAVQVPPAGSSVASAARLKSGTTGAGVNVAEGRRVG